MSLSPEIAGEVEEMLNTNPPKWVVTKTNAVIENEMVKSKLSEDYTLFMDNEEYILYQLKN